MTSRISGSRRAALLCAACLLAAGSAVAETAPPFAALLARARAAAPRLAQAKADTDIARGQALQAATRPNPVLNLEMENFAGSGPFGGAGLAETTVSFAQTLETGGKRQLRRAAGRAGISAAEARQDQAGFEYAADLAVAYAEAEASGARLAQAEEGLASAQTDANIARELVAAGREAELRVAQAAAERDAALAERDGAVADKEAAFAKLSALAGGAVAFDGVGESLLQHPVSAATSENSAPAVRAARAEQSAAEARMSVERRRALPDVTASLGVRRLAGDDATALVAGASIPLPLFDRNRGATQAAQAELARAEARLREVELEALAGLRAARFQARGAEARATAAASGESAAAEAYRLARIGYEAGRLPLIELSSARRALAAARVRVLDARLARVRAEAEIARLTGRIPFGG